MKREELDALVRDPLNPENAGIAARVYADASRWPAFEKALYPDAEPGEAELRAIRRVVAERCGGAEERRREWLRGFVTTRLERISGGMRDFALAASAREGGGCKAPEGAPRDAVSPETVTFVFVSEPSDGPDGRRTAWRAEMDLPADAGVDEMLPIVLSDGAGGPAPDGVFKIAGVALPVVRGRAEIPYGMFLSGLKEARVEFVNAEGVRSPGALALF